MDEEEDVPEELPLRKLWKLEKKRNSSLIIGHPNATNSIPFLSAFTALAAILLLPINLSLITLII